MKLLKKIGIVGALLGVALGCNFAMAASIPATPAVFETYLAAQEASTDTSLSLASASLRDGSTLSGYVCLTVDSNTPSLEYECGTLSGTTVSGLTRGLDAITGTSTISSLAVTHRRGADVKVSDYPILTNLGNIAAGVETIPAVEHYVTGTTVSGSDLQALANVSYVNSVAVSGAPNASQSVKGLVQISTAVQNASSTNTGSTGAVLVVGSNQSTSTPTYGCNGLSTAGALCNVIALNDGKLSPIWLNGTGEYYQFNAAYTTSASSTNATTTNETVTGNLIANNASFSGTVSGVSGVSATNFEAVSTISKGQAVYSGYGASDGGEIVVASGAGNGTTPSINAGSSANRVMVVVVNAHGGSGDQATSLTYGGQSFTSVDNGSSNSCNGANSGYCNSWILVNPASGSNTLAITLSGGSASWYYSVIGNAKQSGQPEAHASTNCTNSSESVTTVANGAIVVSASTPSASVSGTGVWENTASDSTNITGGDSGLVYPASKSVSISVNNTSGTYCFLVSIAPANAPVQGVLPSSSLTSGAGSSNSQFINGYTTFMGFALGSATYGQPITIQTEGIYATSTTLNSTPVGYYLNDTPGSIGTSPGTNTRKVGMEASTTALDITNIW